MSTRSIFVWGMGLSLSFAAMLSGCYIEDYDHDGDAMGDWGVNEPGSVGVCHSFCDTLLSCDTLSEDAHSACVDECYTRHASTPYMTEQGATCVVEQECKEIAAYDCPGAPFPKNDVAESDGDNDSDNDSDNDNENGEGDSSPGEQPTSCNADCDCPSGNACVEGTCKTPCNASCDCAEGESCEAGYCEPPPDPAISCEVDCDCPSGQVCVEGACTDPT